MMFLTESSRTSSLPLMRKNTKFFESRVMIRISTVIGGSYEPRHGTSTIRWHCSPVELETSGSFG